ncbi:MAG: 4Fe-4S dicluster domain-containing protein [Desulfobacteraceae bacterium]|nr:MAG: 4Fe-4S dicluster domain-containing protein [Desulfobacteraceae bacterium]
MNNDSENALKKDLKRIEINRDLCKGCGICVAFCPKKVLELNEYEKSVVKNPDQCIYCGLCEQRCPDLAIEIIK